MVFVTYAHVGSRIFLAQSSGNLKEGKSPSSFNCCILEFLGLWGQIILMKAIPIKFMLLQTGLLNLPQNNLYLLLILN